MDAINTLRAVLVGGAALAGVVAAVFGYWPVAGLLAIGIAFHGLLWVHLHHSHASGVSPPVADGEPPPP